MARKLQKDENYLALIPVRNPNLEFTTDDKGIVTIVVPNVGFFNKVAQKFFAAPKESRIHLDAYSSYTWLGINGKRNIEELGSYMKRKYKGKAEPLYPRLIKFIQILKDNRYIGMYDQHGEQIK